MFFTMKNTELVFSLFMRSVNHIQRQIKITESNISVKFEMLKSREVSTETLIHIDLLFNKFEEPEY